MLFKLRKTKRTMLSSANVTSATMVEIRLCVATELQVNVVLVVARIAANVNVNIHVYANFEVFVAPIILMLTIWFNIGKVRSLFKLKIAVNHQIHKSIKTPPLSQVTLSSLSNLQMSPRAAHLTANAARTCATVGELSNGPNTNPRTKTKAHRSVQPSPCPGSCLTCRSASASTSCSGTWGSSSRRS